MKESMYLVLSLISFNLIAGSGHFHPMQIVKCKAECTQDEAKSVSAAAVKHLAEKGKIPSSWVSAPLDRVELKQFKKGPEWVLTFIDKTKEQDKQKLYVFVTTKGWLNGSNFTGE